MKKINDYLLYCITILLIAAAITCIGFDKYQNMTTSNRNIFTENNDRSIKAIDNSGEIKIDTDTPLLILLSSKKYIFLDEKFVDSGFIAYDEVDGDLTNKVVVNSTINNKVPGTYVINYSICDKSGNCAEEKRYVDVINKNDVCDKVPILAYHHFMSSKEKNKYRKKEKYTMSIDVFDKQMKYLHDNGYNVVDLKTFEKWHNNEIELPKKTVAITIDDGNISSYLYAVPILEKYGFKATIFVITNRINDYDSAWDPQKSLFLSKNIIEDIKKNHVSISLESHSNSMHSTINGVSPMIALSEEEMIQDLKISKEILNAEYFAYPFGWYNYKYLSAVKKVGFKMAFTFSVVRQAKRSDGIYEIPRMNVNAETSMNKFITYIN